MAERANSYTPPVAHVLCNIRVCISPGARDSESTVAHGFVKHAFKELHHGVVDDPLQASRCQV